MKRKGTYIVDEGNTLDVHVFSIERVLQEFDYVIAYGVFSREALCPCQDFSGSKSGLLYWE